MSLLIMCSNPDCGELFETPGLADGAEVRCPACGTVQDLAAGKDQAAEAARADISDLLDQPAPSEVESPPPQDAQPLILEDPQTGPRRETVDLTPKEEAAERRAAPSARPPAPSRADRPAARAQAESIPPADSAGEAAAAEQPADAAPAQTGPSLEGWTHAELPLLDAVASAAEEPASGQDVLRHKLATTTVIVVGLLGMGGGIAAGLSWFPAWPIPAVYLGAAAGWAVGFAVSFFLILGAQRDEQQARCPSCRGICPGDEDVCRFCGTALPQTESNPLAAGCARSGAYALGNPAGICVLTLLIAAAAIIIAGTRELLAAFAAPLAQVRPVLIGLCAVMSVLVASYWLRYMLEAAERTMRGAEKPPDAPAFWSPRTISAGLKVAGLLAAYVAPIVFIPLLPVGFVLLAGSDTSGFDVPLAARCVWRRPGLFATLWLFLLMWLAAAVLAAAVAVIVVYHLYSLPAGAGELSRGVLAVCLWAVAAGAIGGTGSVLALAMFRCMGLYGRGLAGAAPGAHSAATV